MATQRRRVLFLIPTLMGGGAERVIVTLLQHLDRRLFELSLAVVDVRGADFRNDVPADVEFIDLGCTRVRQALFKVPGLLRRVRPDVVFSTLGHLNLGLALLRPLLPGHIRYIARETTIASYGIQEYRAPGLWALAYRMLYRRFDRVVCQSVAMHDDLITQFGLPPERATVIHNPLDIGRIRTLARQALPADGPQLGRDRPDDVLHLVGAGRLVAQKGFALMVEGLALAADPRWQLTLLGDGPERTRLAELARALGVADRVHFAGFRSNPHAYFARAGAFGMSSRYEGFPNVVLEALACGTPVVSLPSPGGLREITEPVAGCVMATAMTAQAFAEALQRFVPVRIGDAAVARFAVDNIVRRYTDELLAEHRSGIVQSR